MCPFCLSRCGISAAFAQYFRGAEILNFRSCYCSFQKTCQKQEFSPMIAFTPTCLCPNQEHTTSKFHLLLTYTSPGYTCSQQCWESNLHTRIITPATHAPRLLPCPVLSNGPNSPIPAPRLKHRHNHTPHAPTCFPTIYVLTIPFIFSIQQTHKLSSCRGSGGDVGEHAEAGVNIWPGCRLFRRDGNVARVQGGHGKARGRRGPGLGWRGRQWGWGGRRGST
ncbi:hypothetical protein K438DRAFT_2038057 [Mycena galopus ATCC 62051]|nr:hypothetical protein K438DRAFT_2038057 [Mycena galopus ATCC 62051]